MARLLGVILASLLLHTTAFADDFFDILNKLPIQRPDSTTQALNTTLYAASVQMTLRDRDGNNANFSNGDLMESLVLSSRGGTLAWPAGDRAAVEEFAKAHGKEIVEILFPSGIAADTIGQPESQLYTSLVFNEVIAPLQKPRSTREKKKDDRVLRNELSGRFEYTSLEINDNDGQSVGALLSYRRDFTDQLEAGILVPYRFTKIDDNVNTKAHLLQFDLYGKYTLYDKEVKVKAGADVFTSVLASQSDAIDVFGNLGYGGGIFSSIEKDFETFIVTFGLGFKLSKATIPDSLVPDDYKYLADAINDRAVDRDLVYGVNVGIPYQENFILNVSVHRTNSFSPDIAKDRDTQTKLLVAFQYALSKTFELNAGYSTVFEVKDYTPHTFFLGAIRRF